jgi:hypothetical protein
MSGKPKRRAIEVALEARTRDYFEIPDGEPCPQSIMDYAVAWVENGSTLRRLADDLSIELGFTVWQGAMVTLLLQVGGDVSENERRLKNARARGANAVVEDAQAIVDEPAADQVAVSQAASRARVRLWTAERWNRDEYGKSPEVQVAISAGSLHLEAMRAPRARAAVVAPEVRALPEAAGSGDPPAS